MPLLKIEFFHGTMWNLASNAISGTIRLRSDSSKASQAGSECSDDEVSSNTSRDRGRTRIPYLLEIVQHCRECVPYVLWCGHTLCKNCVLGLQCMGRCEIPCSTSSAATLYFVPMVPPFIFPVSLQGQSKISTQELFPYLDG
ncbi:hypothetical protein IFM89_032465 [Coptis chinensis]|uniref:RING-type domain-containing protein n=1 Tax=Coptis chinensis TaxID=261450 RepID=A0A835I2M9_9MAGN|nr:hypothetical protein IFM89_032465 [Coptis chinensis]